MRQYFEELEDKILAPYAVRSSLSKGRQHHEPQDNDTRTCFQRDRDRIIHTAAFRRLHAKTQVFIALTGDHYRSRLTHTIEVAQVSRHVSRLLRVNEDLSECIALAHDLGHTPFGHSGERVLHELMADHGGFEHNRQSRRIVDHIESKYPNFDGINLSYECREGLLKHQTPWDHPADTDGFVSIEAQVVNIADEIAYNNHDIDDGLYAGILEEDHLLKHVALFSEAHDLVCKPNPSLNQHERRHVMNRFVIAKLIDDVYRQTTTNIKKMGILGIEDIQKQTAKIVSFSKPLQEQCRELRMYLYKHFYKHKTIAQMNNRGKEIIRSLFKRYIANPSDLPLHVKQKADTVGLYLVLADYISGMTDTYARDKMMRLC